MGKIAPIQETEDTRRPASLWRNSNFLLLWGGQVVSTFGSTLSDLTTPLLVLALVHSPSAAGNMATISMLPYLLLSLIGGTLIDRWDRKKVMIVCDVIRWLAMSSVPLAFLFGFLNIVQLYIVGFITGAAGVLFGIAQISSLPRIVPAEHLPRAYSLSELTENGMPFVGKNVAPLILKLVGTAIGGAIFIYLIDSTSYLVSALSLGFIRTSFQAERTTMVKRAVWQEMKEGLHFLWSHRSLLILALLTATINFMTISISLALIVLSEQRMHLDILWLGIILSASGVGALLGGGIAPWIRARFRFGHIVLASVGGMALGLLLTAVASSVPMLLIGRGLTGAMWTIYAVAMVTYRLSLIPDEMQGRVTSAFRFLSFGAEPIGAFVWGSILLERIGPRIELGLMALGLFLSCILVSFTRIRRA